MTRLKENVIKFGLKAVIKTPNDWDTGTDQNLYQLILRMFNLNSIDDIFLHTFPASYRENNVDSQQIVEMDVSVNDLKTIETHQMEPLIELRVLNASLNRISRCTGVGVLVNLRTLNLSHNQLAVVSNELSKCRYLTTLHLSVNQIKDLSQTPVLSSVRNVFLDHNQLGSLNGIQSFPSLRELHIQHNHLKDLTPVRACVQLVTLNAADNSISSLYSVTEVLQRLKRLEDLSLLNNPVTQDPNYKLLLTKGSNLRLLDTVNVLVPHLDNEQDENKQYQKPTSQQSTMNIQQTMTNDEHSVSHRSVMSRDHDRYRTSMMEVARQSFYRHLHERRKETDDKIRYLVKEIELMEEDFMDYEEKTLCDLNACQMYVSSLREGASHAITSEFFEEALSKPVPERPWGRQAARTLHTAVAPPVKEYPLPAAVNAQLVEAPLPKRLHKSDYRDVKDTHEVLRHTYNELATLSTK